MTQLHTVESCEGLLPLSVLNEIQLTNQKVQLDSGGP